MPVSELAHDVAMISRQNATISVFDLTVVHLLWKLVVQLR